MLTEEQKKDIYQIVHSEPWHKKVPFLEILISDLLEEAWAQGAEATADWLHNNPPASGIWSDPPSNPYLDHE